MLAYSLSHGIGSRRLSRSSGLAEDGAVAPHCDLPHRVDQNGKNSRRVLSPSSANQEMNEEIELAADPVMRSPSIQGKQNVEIFEMVVADG